MRSALGKGLGALISEETVASVAATPTPAAAPAATPSSLPINRVKANPNQPRREFDEAALADLAASVKEKGILQPILVAPLSDGNFEIIAGERRWRAAQRAGLTEIPAVVRSASETEKFEMALIENIQREGLNPIEQAQGYKRLQEEFNLTQEAIAKVMSKDRAVIANTLRLLSLPEAIQSALSSGKISAGHGRALAAIEDATAREALFQRILSENLPVRAVEEAVRSHKGKPSKTAAPEGEKKSAEIRSIEEELQRSLVRKVEFQISGAASQKGWIKLEFYSLDDLDNLLRQLKSLGQSS